MATTSGKGGTVEWNSTGGQSGTELTAVLGWTLNRTVMVDKFATNDSGGWKVGVSGVSDWSATVRCKYDAATNIVPQIGQEVEVTLFIDESEGISNQYDRYYANCVAENVELEVDVDTGKAVAFVLSISSDGALSFTETTQP